MNGDGIADLFVYMNALLVFLSMVIFGLAKIASNAAGAGDTVEEILDRMGLRDPSFRAFRPAWIRQIVTFLITLVRLVVGTTLTIVVLIAGVPFLLLGIAAVRDISRFGDLFALIFSKRVREKLWDPSFSDLLLDYFDAKEQFQGNATRWVEIVFHARAAVLAVQTIVTAIYGATIGKLFQKVAK